MRLLLSDSDFTSATMSSLSFLYLRSWAGVSGVVLQLALDVLVLQAAQLLVVVGDRSKVSSTRGLSSASMADEGDVVLHVVFVVVALGRRAAPSASAGLGAVASPSPSIFGAFLPSGPA